MKRAADKLVDIAAGRPGAKTQAKPKSKPTANRATTAKAAKPNGDNTRRAKRSVRASKTPQPVPRPLTDTQKTVVQLIHAGHSISAAMAQIGMSRGSFYTWRKQNPRFQHATRNAREDYRGLVTDGLEDLQVATAQFLDACIRSDNLSVRDRLRACNTFLRHVHSGAFVPASFPGDDPNPALLDDDLTGPDLGDPDCSEGDLTSDLPTGNGLPGDLHSGPSQAPPAQTSPASNPKPASPYGPVNDAATASDAAPNTAENPAQNAAETHRPDVQSATATSQGPATEPTHSEQNPLAASITNLTTTENCEKTVQSVQSKTTESTQSAASEIRTPNVSDGLPPSPERERRVPAESPILPAPIPTAEGAPSSTSNNNTASSDERSDVASTPGEQRSDLANKTPEAGSRKPEAVLSQQWLSATFLHKHEPRAAFETLLKHHMGAYAPATPQEELLTFRITQKSWILRRLDTLDRVIADSAVTKIRDKHPNAAPAACIAMTYLTRGDTEETRFHERIAAQRKDHEAALDRLEAKLQTLQARRESREHRREAREEQQRGGPRLVVFAPADATTNPDNRGRSAA
jgi:hypothetical protein